MPYIDLYVLPIPEANLAAYKKIAAKYGKIMREHGALSYREVQGNAAALDEGASSLLKAVKPKEGEVVIASISEFKTRAHRDQVMKKMAKDPRIEKMMEETPPVPPKKMFYGGFASFVNA
jgi:uncharacterized protein YbaA (DUF1428 family)